MSVYLTKPSVKQRYNWGYQDGKNAAKRSQAFRPAGLLKTGVNAKHFDSKYQDGYETGFWEERDSCKI